MTRCATGGNDCVIRKSIHPFGSQIKSVGKNWNFKALLLLFHLITEFHVAMNSEI